ncbi:MAG: replication initiation protein [Peptoniphilaceae bacterium]
MYRLLKQFKATGYAVFEIDNFRNLLDIPDSYKMGNIDQQVLKPIMSELPQFLKGLKINKIKGTGKYKKI